MGGMCFHTSSSTPFPCAITQKTIPLIHESPPELPFQNAELVQLNSRPATGVRCGLSPKAEPSQGLSLPSVWLNSLLHTLPAAHRGD